MALQIRLATERDARTIASIHVRCWQHAYRGIVPDTVLDSLSEVAYEQLWRHSFEAPSANRRVWIADEGGRTVGFCATDRNEDADATATTAEVGAIYLEPDLIGTGIGRILFGQAVDDLGERGFRTAVLWVFGENARARRFYEAAGWHADGTERTRARGGAKLAEVRFARDLSDT